MPVVVGGPAALTGLCAGPGFAKISSSLDTLFKSCRGVGCDGWRVDSGLRDPRSGGGTGVIIMPVRLLESASFASAYKTDMASAVAITIK
jgi:hypothetical protein